MCINRVEKYIESGYNRKYLPACAKTCPSDAIYFGTRDKMVSLAKERLEELKLKYPEAYTYNVDTNNSRGGGAMMYVLSYKPSVYDLPEE